jgi:putative SOS response-associated peptidase YedK
MCSHYQGIAVQEKFYRRFGMVPPQGIKADLWPGYVGAFVRAHPHANVGDEAAPLTESLPGLFGLVPHWSTDTKITKSTYNARSETVASKPSFRDAVRKQQRCIIPAQSIYEPDWRSGKAIATRIEGVDGEMLGIAGLWSCWQADNGASVYSYTMLTINADAHPLLNQFHKPTDEKRMVVILEPERYADWLNPQMPWENFMVPYAAASIRAVVPDPVQNSLMD